MLARRSSAGLVTVGAIIVAIGFAVALVRTLELPGYSIWFVVGGGLLLVGLVRRLTRPRR